MNDLYDKIMQSAINAVEKRVYEMAASIQSNLTYEFQNDLVYAGHGKEQGVLSSLRIEVNKTSDTQYNLSVDLSGLTDSQKELFEFYFENSKKKYLSH